MANYRKNKMENESSVLHEVPQDIFSPVLIAKISQKTRSEWVCYLYGSYGGDNAFKYYPAKDNIPNFLTRFMMRVFLGCRWEKKLKDNATN